MRILLISLFSLFLFSGISRASETAPQQSFPDRDDANIGDGAYGDFCIGGKYESDEDINEGNRITDEEIRRLLYPPTS
jgi:hypothetical protein